MTPSYIIPPAAAAKVRGCETPEWDAALAAHHDDLVAAGIETWADEGAKLTAPPRPRKKKVPAAK